MVETVTALTIDGLADDPDNAAVGGNLTVAGTLVVSGALTAASLTVTGDITVGGLRQPKVSIRDIDDGPPASPADGDIWIAEDVGAENSGIRWVFSFNSDSSNANKWECIGGAHLFHEVLAFETTASGTFGDLTTVGPTVTVPRAGEYDIHFGARMGNTTNGSAVAPKLGGATTSLGDAAEGGGPDIAVARTVRKVLAAADVVKLQYAFIGGGTARAMNRWIEVIPLRVQ